MALSIYVLTVTLLAAAMVAAYGLARVLTGAARALALRWGVVSAVTARSSHATPTARLGGIGLACGFGLAAAIFLLVLWRIPHGVAILGFNPALVGWVALGWLMMLGVGLLDDLADLPPPVKLILMTLAALAPAWGGEVVFDPPTYLALPTRAAFAMGVAASLLWILFFTNAYNFMDGMDGFAASFARVAAAGMFLIVLLAGMLHGSLPHLRAEACLPPILAMACWGFLYWNRPPARVFMGDGGSLSVGYLLAVHAILGWRGALGLNLPLVSSLTILLPFIFDVLLTLARRARRGQNLLVAHREHLYQRLLRTGLTHDEVLRLNLHYFYFCALAALIGGLIEGTLWRWAGAAVALAAMLDYWRRTLRREKIHLHADGPSG